MQSKNRSILLSLFLVAIAVPALAQNYTLLHSFSGADGGSPTGLIQTADGTFYGAAVLGGDTTACDPDGCGNLFKIDSAGHFTVLHVFHATDGYHPTGLVKGSDGNFYGTTESGGQPSGGGAGTLFRLDPADNFKVLYAFAGGFACCDGAGPTGPPTQARDGNFYGTTGGGGAFRDIHHQGGLGTVYRLNPVTGAVTILHSFNFDGNGFYPNSPLIQGRDGLLYGTTRQGSGPFRDGPGTAFKIDTAGNFTFVAVLAGQPLSGLIQANDGNFYGTSEGFGGSVFRLAPTGNLTFINRFESADGWNPHYRLLQAADGFFYGTAPQGGLLDFQGGNIFRLSASGALTVLHSFLITGADGFGPNSQLVQGTDGALYGVTGIGGANKHGTIFRFDQRIPGPVASVTVKLPVIHSGERTAGTVKLSSPAPPGGLIVNLGAVSFQVSIPSKVTVQAGKTKRAFTIKALNVGAAQTFHVYAYAAGQGVRTTMTALP
jgi:uncharacterized repeat protein (TIGR03803 family)